MEKENRPLNISEYMNRLPEIMIKILVKEQKIKYSDFLNSIDEYINTLELYLKTISNKRENVNCFSENNEDYYKAIDDLLEFICEDTKNKKH